AHRIPLEDGSGFPGQDEEGGLESVVGVVGVLQHPAAHAEDHRAVTAEQGREGRLVPRGDKAAQQLPVGPAPARRLEVFEYLPEASRHAVPSPHLIRAWAGAGASVNSRTFSRGEPLRPTLGVADADEGRPSRLTAGPAAPLR